MFDRSGICTDWVRRDGRDTCADQAGPLKKGPIRWLAASGLPSILIPYPHHKDNQQIKNAQWLSEAGAAVMIQQAGLTADKLLSTISRLDADRSALADMAIAALGLANPHASETIANRCLEAANG